MSPGRERWPSPPPPGAASGIPRAVRAKRPNHVWMVDLTDVKGLFGIVTFKVAVVFDAFSRMAVATRSQHEIELYRKYPGYFGYVFFVMTPDEHGGHDGSA